MCKVRECVEKGTAGISCPHVTIRQMYAFDHDKKTEAFSVAGKVTKNCILEPACLEDYGLMMKAMAREAEISRNRKSTKGLVAESNTLMGTDGEMAFIPPAHANKELRVERSGEDLKQDLLTILNENEFMTMKELLERCKCFESNLRPLLELYCQYHKNGQHRYSYELKNEYKAHA